ncbi:MAG: potassium channel family protein [Candidatus Electryonea clarkiae]|nr:potassium channel family protein [Candidatus Electryonea clarkiae]MDP8286592.1 potassium channel family protein [Candidatus Electryonea clarkiae]
MSRITEKWREIKDEMIHLMQSLLEAHLHRVFGILLALMLLGAVLLWFIEGHDTFPTPFDALWWSLVTITTVGYGDISPEHFPGKLTAMLIILAGVALVSMFTATVSSVFVASKIKEGRGLQEVFYQNHIVILGWYPGAERLLEALSILSGGKIRLALVNDLPPASLETVLEHFKDLKPKFVRGDFSSDTILKKAGVAKADSVIILPDTQNAATAAQVDQRTILAALTIKDINQKIQVHAHALESESIPHMRRGGVDRVVLRDAYAGYFLACHALVPGVPEVLDELLTLQKGNQIDRIPIPKTLTGKKVEEVRDWVQNDLNGILIGLVVQEKVIDVSDILSDDLSSIDAFIKRKFEEAGRSAEELATTRIQINPDPEREVAPNELAVIIHKTEQAA